MKTNKTKSNNEMSYTDPTNQPGDNPGTREG